MSSRNYIGFYFLFGSCLRVSGTELCAYEYVENRSSPYYEYRDCPRCCGSFGSEYCCEPWESVAGAVVGGFCAVGVIVSAVICIAVSHNRKKMRVGTTPSTTSSSSPRTAITIWPARTDSPDTRGRSPTPQRGLRGHHKGSSIHNKSPPGPAKYKPVYAKRPSSGPRRTISYKTPAPIVPPPSSYSYP